MKFLVTTFFLWLCMLAAATATGQDTLQPADVTPLFDSMANTVILKEDSALILKQPVAPLRRDTVMAKPMHDPRKATLRSAIIPGWGQAYNRQYWKIPIVYGVLAIPASLYVYNNSFYQKTKFAYSAVYAATLQTPVDQSMLLRIDPKVMNRTTGQPFNLATYQSYRNSFKRNKDYSILWFFIAWAANIADATVFGHLKDFDVSDDLSLKLQPVYMPDINGSGMGLVLGYKKPQLKPLPLQ